MNFFCSIARFAAPVIAAPCACDLKCSQKNIFLYARLRKVRQSRLQAACFGQKQCVLDSDGGVLVRSSVGHVRLTTTVVAREQVGGANPA
jgi:hypothetical protein